MSIGVGGSTVDEEFSRLSSLDIPTEPLPASEYVSRLKKAGALIQSNGFDAIYLTAGSNLQYFTGTVWHASERLAGAILTASGDLDYITPWFERPTFTQHMVVEGEIHTWHEHESPFALFVSLLQDRGISKGKIGIDEATPFHHFGEISALTSAYQFVDARPVTAGCRSCKSQQEIRLIQAAMHKTLEVHKSAARILREGISTTEVAEFIDRAHRVAGASGGSTFCAVQFGEATAYPHGVPDPQVLQENDIVLIDTGCRLHSYHSDITRTYVIGEATKKQREVWDAEKAAQAKAFETAQPGTRCGDVDIAVRGFLEEQGFGPGYSVPGLPHRTGHGLGLDIHEWPYLVQSEDTLLDVGMCFSNEPMLCLYGEFGVRLEDHFYVTVDGPRWFTTPSHAIDDPFGAG
jgi:Xaa-Pro dipeptidase